MNNGSRTCWKPWKEVGTLLFLWITTSTYFECWRKAGNEPWLHAEVVEMAAARRDASEETMASIWRLGKRGSRGPRQNKSKDQPAG